MNQRKEVTEDTDCKPAFVTITMIMIIIML